jgi:hypothetical protein
VVQQHEVLVAAPAGGEFDGPDAVHALFVHESMEEVRHEVGHVSASRVKLV